MRLGAVLCCLALAVGIVGCQATLPDGSDWGRQQSGEFTTTVTKTLRGQYLLYLPEDYGEKERWPLILFLHGVGERGDNLDRVKIHGPPKLIAKGKSFPFIVLSPQCPAGQWWDVEMLDALLNKIEADYAVDPDRVYVTGLSMGGFGTWALAGAYPDRFAAIAPICGGGEPVSARYIKHLPTWVFHGDKDAVVPIKRSQEMVDALKACNGNVKFTIYPGAGHDSWTETYNNAKLYEWFLKHKRVQPEKCE